MDSGAIGSPDAYLCVNWCADYTALLSAGFYNSAYNMAYDRTYNGSAVNPEVVKCEGLFK